MIGLKKGDEKSFKIVYKSDYAQKRFAGKAVEFRVAVKGVYEAKLPEATDEWAKSFGNFENMGQLREAIKKNLLSEKETKEEERAELEALDLIFKYRDIRRYSGDPSKFRTGKYAGRIKAINRSSEIVF